MPDEGSKVLSSQAEGSKYGATEEVGEKEPEEKEDWMPLALAFLFCSAAAGIIPGQTLYNRLFADAGVFKGACPAGHKETTCDEQYLLMAKWIGFGQVFLTFSQVVLGGIFDRWGGPFCCYFGAMIVAASFVLIGVLLYALHALPAWNLVLSHSIVAMVIVSDMGSWLNSYAMLAFVWHYPNNRAFVIATANANYQAGAIFAMLVEGVVDLLGTSLAVPFILYAICLAAAAGPSTKLIPEQEESFARAEAHLEMVVPKATPKLALAEKCKNAYKVLSLDGWAHAVLGASLICNQVLTTYHLSIASPLADHVFRTPGAGYKMGNLVTVITVIFGVTGGPLIGTAADHFGFGVMVYGQAIFVGILLATFMLPNWSMAAISIISNTFCIGIFWVMLYKWLQAFCLPHRVGSVQSVYYVPVSVIAAGLLWGVTEWSESLPTGFNRFVVPLWYMGALTLAFCVLFCLYYYLYDPLPGKPRVIPEDELEAEQQPRRASWIALQRKNSMRRTSTDKVN